MPIALEQYTEKAIALFGDTEPLKDKIKAIGGKYNANLRGRPGWIFMNSSRPKVEAFIKSLDSGEEDTPQASPVIKEEKNDITTLFELLKKLELRIQALEKSITAPDDVSEPEPEKPKRLLKRN